MRTDHSFAGKVGWAVKARGLAWRLTAVAPVMAIVVGGVIAYHNSFQGRFVFDGRRFIVENESIRRLWPVTDVIRHTTRPLVRLSFALNYAAGGLDVFGYHAANLAIHLLAGLALFGLIRRSLRSRRLRDRFADTATPVAACAALWWVVHPIQTESVTYIFQRAESLMGLCYLLTLYCLSAGVDHGRWGRLWHSAAVLFCALGMGAKPVMVTAPLMALLYDRVFLASSWKEVWKRRLGLHAGLMATWLILTWIVLSPHESRLSAGTRLELVTPLEYIRTQPQVLLHYMRLVLWPFGFALDYAWPVERSLVGILVPGAAIAALLAPTAWLMRKRPEAGFLGAWFFITLAPSSLVPLSDLAFEHRMYLALASFTVGVALALEGALRSWTAPDRRRLCLAVCGLLLAAPLCLRTLHRNRVYHSRIAVWTDVVKKRPHNARAYHNLAVALQGAGREKEGLKAFRKSVEINPSAAVRVNLDDLRVPVDREEMLQRLWILYETIQVNPYDVQAHVDFGEALSLVGSVGPAARHFRTAILLDTRSARARRKLGILLAETGDLEEALRELERARRLEPGHVDVHNALGVVLAELGRLDEACASLETAAGLDPSSPEIPNNLGTIMDAMGRHAEAVVYYRRALELDPEFGQAHNNLGVSLARQGRYEEAVVALAAALRLLPGDEGVRLNLEEASAKASHSAFPPGMVAATTDVDLRWNRK